MPITPQMTSPEMRQPAPLETRELAVTPEMAGQRLDKVLASAFPDMSRARLQQIIRDGGLDIGGTACADLSRKLQEGLHLTLRVPEPLPATPAPQAIPLTVIYEDAHLIVIDKPAKLVVHPAAGHEDGTLVNALIAHCGETLSGIGGVKRPGIVHRLDKDTTGLLVVAKTDQAHQGLAAQFADHGRTGPLERAYLAIVWGVPNRPHGTIDAAIDRSVRAREKMTVVAQGRGRQAITHFTLLEQFRPAGTDATVASLIRCELETGRTHQIRVHLAHIGHPLLGDPLYGTGFITKARQLSPGAQEALGDLGRQALHAAVLGFEHPVTKAHMQFERTWPEDLANLHTELTKM
jgi:23S rRNA pseudouridine1911/1915/1917 synthase